MSTTNASMPKQKPRQPSIIFGFISLVLKIIGISFLAWFFILFIFIGEFFFKGQAQVIATAQVILHGNMDSISVRQSLLTHVIMPLLLSVKQNVSSSLSYLSALPQQFTFLPGFLKFLSFHHSNHYQHGINAVLNFFKVIFLGSEIILSRLSIFVLALPFLCIILFVAITDGLVTRYVRRAQGARESAFLFHHIKHLSGFWFDSLFFVFMTLPFFIQPTWFLLVQTIALAFTARLSVAYFKKYL